MRELTRLAAVELAAGIRRREFTCEQVVAAHVEILRLSHTRLNAVVADCFDSALAQARACDSQVAQRALRGESLESLPPLYGVPFTVKESIALQGMPQTAGLRSRVGQSARATAPAVVNLLDAGAIPLGVTNVSEMTLWIESENPVYGRTNNPYDRQRSAGGSSGGEAAAVGVGGSPFGIGADIGGSIRTPALFCGVFGHKPSSALVSSQGIWPDLSGPSQRLLATGPLTRRAVDLMPLLRLLAGEAGAEQLGDPGAVELEGMSVTLIDDGPRGAFSAALRQARSAAAQALAAAGASVRLVSLPVSWRSLLAYLMLLQEDPSAGFAPTRALLRGSGDEASIVNQLLASAHTLPTRLTLAGEQLGRMIRGQPRERLIAGGRALAEELIAAIGDGVLLHPAHPTQAPLHRRTYGRPWVVMPAAIFNMADVPVTEVPMGLASNGLPVGIQVAAAPGADHRSVAVALALEASFGGWVPPGGA